MRRAQQGLAAALVCALSLTQALGEGTSAVAAPAASPALVFTGDVLLSRLVAREVQARKQSPWSAHPKLFGPADLVVGNLEGAVGSAQDCLPQLAPHLCFAVQAELLAHARQAGFVALGLANNHAGDLGEPGTRATPKAVQQAGMQALHFAASPQFLELDGRRVAMVSFTRVQDALGRFSTLDLDLAQRLDLARQLGDAAIAYVHWGTELQTWPSETQRAEARWLIAQGAGAVIGHHPHVIQAPDCVDERPVFYSLGNHLFDQHYPSTRRGLLARCSWKGEVLDCTGQFSEAAPGSSFVRVAAGQVHPGCQLPAAQPMLFGKLRLRGAPLKPRSAATDAEAPGTAPTVALEIWEGPRLLVRLPPRPLRRAAAVRLRPDGPTSLLLLEERYSNLDRRVAPRPYIYAVEPQGLRALWRGSALAYPLADATVLSLGTEDLLCALHEPASFLTGRDPDSSAPRFTRSYRWQEFGFAASQSEAGEQACQQRYAHLLRPEGEGAGDKQP